MSLYLNEINQTYQQSVDLKYWMQSINIFDKDLFNVLVHEYKITHEKDVYATINTKYKLDEVIRKVRVLRLEDIKETKSRQRCDKLLKKFEKIVYDKNFKKKRKKRKSGQEPPQYQHSGEYIHKLERGKTIKEWLRRNDVWIKELYDELLKEQCNDPEMIKYINVTTFDRIIRNVRVERFVNVNDQKVRKRLDQKLVNFEKIWREQVRNKKKKKKKKNQTHSLSLYHNVNGYDSKSKSRKKKAKTQSLGFSKTNQFEIPSRSRPAELDMNNIKIWSNMDVINWFEKLIKSKLAKKYKSYRKKLRFSLQEYNITGDEMKYINVLTLKMWGIYDENDRKVISDGIMSLTSETSTMSTKKKEHFETEIMRLRREITQLKKKNPHALAPLVQKEEKEKTLMENADSSNDSDQNEQAAEETDEDSSNEEIDEESEEYSSSAAAGSLNDVSSDEEDKKEDVNTAAVDHLVLFSKNVIDSNKMSKAEEVVHNNKISKKEEVVNNHQVPKKEEVEEEFLSIEEAKKVPGKHKEKRLNDADFESVFSMTKDEFYKQPSWKRKQLKRCEGLY